MKHLKIRVKLLLGFALVSVIAMAVGLVGVIGLTSTSSQYKKMLELSNEGISSMANIRELFQLERLMLRAMLIDIHDPELLENDISNLKSYETQMADAMAAYESTITDKDAESNYYMAKDTYLDAFAAIKEDFIAAARQGDAEDTRKILGEGMHGVTPVIDGLQRTVAYINESTSTISSELSLHSRKTMITLILVMGLGVICAMALGLYISSLISKPIKTMSGFFVRFGETGDLSLSESDRKNIGEQAKNRDEVGKCISAAAQMVSRLNEINENLGRVAAGDITAEISALSEKDSMGLAVKKMVDSLNGIFADLKAASEQVSSGAEQIAQGAQELASGSSEQAAGIEEFSNSLGELQEKTRNSADNSATAAKLNETMGAMIEESVLSMKQMLEAMKGIDESSNSITRVIKVIDDIAFQTNILALNAAVEAARAGQHGKGFAVVADEVRNLASKSAAAAKETASLIEGSSEKVNEGNRIVEKTNSSLEAVAISSKEVMRLIGEVSGASAEQAKSISEINQGIEQISGVVQENSASAEESAAAAEEMSVQAAALNGIVAKFVLKNGKAGYRTSDEASPIS